MRISALLQRMHLRKTELETLLVERSRGGVVNPVLKETGNGRYVRKAAAFPSIFVNVYSAKNAPPTCRISSRRNHRSRALTRAHLFFTRSVTVRLCCGTVALANMVCRAPASLSTVSSLFRLPVVRVAAGYASNYKENQQTSSVRC